MNLQAGNRGQLARETAKTFAVLFILNMSNDSDLKFSYERE